MANGFRSCDGDTHLDFPDPLGLVIATNLPGSTGMETPG